MLVSLATEQGFPYWLAMATILRGWALSDAGEIEQGLAEMLRGLTAFRATEAQLWVPYFLGLVGEVHARAGEPVKGLGFLSEALEHVGQTGERWFEAELHRRTGEILLDLPEPDEAEAEIRIRRALEVARRPDAKMWQLRAATSLARLWAGQGEEREAHDLLAPIYGWFSEGFETPDLKEAKELFVELQ